MTIITTHVGATTVSATETLVLVAGASITAPNQAAISFSTAPVTLWLAGTVWSSSDGIVGTSSTPNFSLASIKIASGANVHGNLSGIFLAGISSNISNLGAITGGVGVELGGGGLQTSVTLVNDGQIIGAATGVAVNFDATGYCDLVLRNRGLITGTNAAISVDDDNSNSYVLNLGTIDGAIFTSSGDDLITNRGHITGSIATGGGADTVNLLRSLDADTSVHLGSGDDVAVLGGSGADSVVGGDGTDQVSYFDARAVTVNLADSSLNRGAALYDELFEFENVVGSWRGNDRITGNALANFLSGAGGADTLVGGGGADTLFGAEGVDSVTGGLGNDFFRLAAMDGSHDIITDFTKIAGNRDKIMFLSDPEDANLNPGALLAQNFVARADNVAQDGDDFIIFRTTDQTLWYDADGNGGLRTAVLLADLAAGVTLVAGDVLIV